jgi:hypothetical protein
MTKWIIWLRRKMDEKWIIFAKKEDGWESG